MWERARFLSACSFFPLASGWNGAVVTFMTELHTEEGRAERRKVPEDAVNSAFLPQETAQVFPC